MLRNLAGIEVVKDLSHFVTPGEVWVARLGPVKFRVVSQQKLTPYEIIDALNEFIKEENVRNSRLDRNRGAHSAG